MKLSKLALLAALISGASASANEGRQAFYQSTPGDSGVALVGHCDCGEAVCGCEAPSCDDAEETAPCDDGCDSSCDGNCGSLCNSGSRIGSRLASLGCCDLGEKWSLINATPLGISFGGWTNLGYHTSNNTGTGILGNGAPANFNNYADKVQLQQQWAYAERIADGSDGLGIGGRIDYIYGTDGPDTQAFGIADTHWDNSWDNGGAYGHAIPQVYGEVAHGDTSVKIGHFFTLIGNEVVAATGNFFYSRQFTFYNAEPFTHTGVLATHALNDCTTLYGGWVEGWDSGFKDNGDAFIGGIKRQLNDDVSLLYATVIGRFGDNANSAALERGSIHSFILTTALTDKLTNLIQYDYLDTDDEASALVRRTHGLNSYFIYQVNDCLSLGSRTEYFDFKSRVNPGGAATYNQTYGVNYKLSSNLMVRPELRTIWDPDNVGINEGNAGTKTAFGMDAILTF